MDNELYMEESSPKKTKLLIILMILIFILCIFLGIIFKAKYTLNVRNNLIFEVGSVAPTDVTDYISNKVIDKNDYKIVFNNFPIDDDGKFNKVGSYTFKVTYGKISRKGKITINDTTKPVVVTTDLTVGVDEEFDPDNFISTCVDYSKPCKVTLKDDDDYDLVKKEGTYKVEISISDKYDNTVDKTVNLIVKKGYNSENVRETNLTIDHIDPDYSDWGEKMIITYNKAIDPDTIEETEYYNDLMEVTASDLHKYLDDIYKNNLITESQIITIYNKYDYIIGYGIRVELDNGLHFYLSK